MDDTPGVENHLILPYDGDWLAAYGDFLAAIDKIVARNNLDQVTAQGLYALADLAWHLEIMVQEACGQMELTEAFMDDVYGTVEEPAASQLLEEVVEFHNLPFKPHGFEILRQIEAEVEGFQIMAVTPMREEDCMIVTVVNMTDSE
ncbi:hypothetical protein D3C78_1023250 [compost metagenome]